MGAASSSEKLPKRPSNRDRTESSSRTTPVSVPARSRSLRQSDGTLHPEGLDAVRPSGPSQDSTSATLYPIQPAYHHPPRLPLPVGGEELTPGSPVLTARDFASAENGLEEEEDLEYAELQPSKSLLSHTTFDDEEESVGDPEGDQQGAETKRRTVPTEVVWTEPGDRVYVTGTFAQWSKKFRMQRDPETGHAKTTLDLLPGVHHIRFIVDGEMRLRDDAAQAVDYTNTLVNYVEVSAEPVFRSAAQEGKRVAGQDEAPPDLHPPLVVPERSSQYEKAKRLGSPPSRQEGEKVPELMEIPLRHYGQQVPAYLLDLDREEKSSRFARASSRVVDIQPPPTLPGFLSKSILNGTMPMKDDSSVLNMPNHTVLNHLATSSIKQGVLATSLTTRYKRKYVTLITYRPTSLED